MIDKVKHSEIHRLKKLLLNVPADEEGKRGISTIAEYLVANGVIVPPVKVGDKIRPKLLKSIWEVKKFSKPNITVASVKTGIEYTYGYDEFMADAEILSE